MEDYNDVVLTTRIRLARNIKGYKFPYNMIDKERKELLNVVKEKLKDKCTILELDNIDDVTKKSLVEKHEISKELLQNSSTAIISDDSKHVVTMVNEEDHFRIQAFANGFDIDKAYENILEADKIIGDNLEYATSKEYGYITACPTCIGTGMRVSVMLHLPGLEKIGLINKIFNEISNLGISIRGIYGENTKGEGSIYQISNQKTLGVTEEQIVEQVKQVTHYIVKQERKARELLKSREDVKNEIMRSLGILKYSTQLFSKEAMQLLSNVRLGINIGYIDDISLEKIDEVINNIGINTLRKNLKENFAKEEENTRRAEYVKKNI